MLGCVYECMCTLEFEGVVGKVVVKGGPISSVWVPEDFPGVEKVVLSMGGDGNVEAL